MEPVRIVLIQHRCFYCGNSDVHFHRLWHLFGLLHCAEHAQAAQEDCEEYMRKDGMIRRCDAIAHPVLGPFLAALGDAIPVLRTSGAVESWCFPVLDERPLILRSRSQGTWGFHLQGSDGQGLMERFVPISQFRDPRILPLLKEDVRDMLEAVENTFAAGFY